MVVDVQVVGEDPHPQHRRLVRAGESGLEPHREQRDRQRLVDAGELDLASPRSPISSCSRSTKSASPSDEPVAQIRAAARPPRRARARRRPARAPPARPARRRRGAARRRAAPSAWSSAHRVRAVRSSASRSRRRAGCQACSRTGRARSWRCLRGQQPARRDAAPERELQGDPRLGRGAGRPRRRRSALPSPFGSEAHEARRRSGSRRVGGDVLPGGGVPADVGGPGRARWCSSRPNRGSVKCSAKKNHQLRVGVVAVLERPHVLGGEAGEPDEQDVGLRAGRRSPACVGVPLRHPAGRSSAPWSPRQMISPG